MAFTLVVLMGALAFTLTTVAGQDASEVVTIAYSMFEEAPKFTYVGNVGTDIANTGVVDDLSVEQRAQLTFSMLSDDSLGDYFTIETDSGVLRTGRRIDREVICPHEVDCSILLNVGVFTGNFFSSINVQVSVDDLNDNPPRFLENTISKSVPENTPVGTYLSLPTADDLDSPRFSIASYQLQSITPEFKLNVSDDLDSMYLVLNEELDRESVSSFSLVVAAFDGGPDQQTGTLTIDITVLDVNDNHPQFLNESYSVTVHEDQAINTVILSVKAVDPDLGANGQVSYGFTTRTSLNVGAMFSIDNKTGDIYLRQQLDYETKEIHNLVVTASENNAESIPIEAKVAIRVMDVNDLPPQITVNALSTNKQVQISESALIGTYVAHIKVDDPDLGLSGEFSCELQQTQEVLEVQELYSGAYTLATSALLDRELHPEYTLSFLCMDKGTPALTSSAEITVTILDENDSAPTFRHRTYSVTLNENNYPGRFLTQLDAEDRDAGENGELEFVLPPLSQRYLRLDQASGNVTARVAFDHEQDSQLSLPVLAVDRGNPALTASATINIVINDLNDEAPEFTLDKYTFQINENSAIGQEVGQVSASDPDSEPFNMFTYSISASTEEPARSSFTVDPQTGSIYTRIRVDREQATDYVLIMTAVDSGDASLYTTSTVSIYVSDINDNFPVITYPSPQNNSVRLDQSVFSGRIIMNVRAHDSDSGANGRLRYTIASGNDHGLFTMDANTGLLTLGPEVESVPALTYRLIVSVQDNGSPPMTSDANLDIIVDEPLAADASGQLLIGGNMTIVVIVAVISGILTLILVIAIILMCHRQGKKNYLSTLLRSPSTEDEPGDQKKRKEVSFRDDVQITDETGPPNQYIQQKATHSSGSGSAAHADAIYSRPSPSKKQCSVHGNLDMQTRHQAATQNNYLLMPVALSKDSDSAHSEDSTNTDSGRGSDTGGEPHHGHPEQRGASRQYHRYLGTVLESQRQCMDDRARTPPSPSRPSYPQQLGAPPLPTLPPRAPTRDATSPYRQPRKTQQQQPQYPRTSSWNSEVQLDDEVFTLTPSHV